MSAIPCSFPISSLTSGARYVAFRLLPGADVLEGLHAAVRTHGFQAAFVAGAVGSLSQVCLRYAGVAEGTVRHGAFEIVALSGTLDTKAPHLHLAVSDATGAMCGGHLLPDCIVRTTLEVVLGELGDVRFVRRPCSVSGYDELVVLPRLDS